MEVEFICPACQKSCQFESDTESTELVCSCGKSYGSVGDFLNDGALNHCGICGCRDLFKQKDFNRKVGCAIAAIGAILAPFTKFISLLVCALIDLVLYRVLPFITICYRCHAIYRDFRANPDHEGFNLGINDRYRASER